MQETPTQLGYRMPAEWEPHVGTWFTWPRPEGISFPDRYDTVPPVYARLFRELIRVEQVHLNVWDAQAEEQARLALFQRDANTWSETLRSAQSSLHDYYDLNANVVEETLMALDALARTPFPGDAPTSPALQSLQQWRASR